MLHARYPWLHVKAGDALLELYSPALNTHVEEFIHLRHRGDSALMLKAEEKLSLLGLTAGQIRALRASRKAPFTVSVFAPQAGYLMPAGSGPDPTGGAAARTPDGAVDGMEGMRGMDRGAVQSGEGGVRSGDNAGWLRQGMYVKKDQTLFVLNDLRKVWGMALGNAASLSTLKTGMAAVIESEQLPGKSWPGRLDFIEPFYERGQKLLRVRLYMENPGLALQVNSLFRATVLLEQDSVLTLPASAVLDLGTRHVVWVRSERTNGGSGLFEIREVTAGPGGENYIIHSGVRAGEDVALHAGLILDSETVVKRNGPRPVNGEKGP
jgi:multidrug efflux pump subunit AcrA (membrane-fusion protein)